MRQLQEFLDMCYPGVTLDTSTPEHIRDYIVFRTQIPGRGRTTVHAISCPQIRTTNSTCSCPTFGKYSSTLQLVKHLKVQFGANKSKQPWEESTQVGNPAKSRMVAELLSAIADEQSLAHVVTKQPVMIAYADLFRVCRYLHAISRDRTVDHSHRWRVNRLHSAMLNSYQTWTRCGNINKILTLAVLRVPGSRMLVFGHTWGKTLAAGSQRAPVWSVASSAGGDVCSHIYRSSSGIIHRVWHISHHRLSVQKVLLRG